MMQGLESYIADKRIIVCCGAGGVGKTTASAAISLAAARLGRRVLVLTIDPSRRLAETLGVDRNKPEPEGLPPERQRAGGIEPPGHLSAWMLDPKLVADQVVRSLADTQQEAEKLMTNPIYAEVTRMIAGMQEYTAMEALQRLVGTDRYDLVVLDTPPSRNALNFLEAPGRLAAFLDGRIFRLFLPQKEGMLRNMASKLVWKVLDTVFGDRFFNDFRVFLNSFASIFSILNGNALAMRSKLQRPDTTFLLVTSPAREALDDAFYFHRRIRQLALPFGGFLLNRSKIGEASLPFPDDSLLPDHCRPEHLSALAKLSALADKERVRLNQDLAVLSTLEERSGGGVPTVALPEIGGGVDDMDGLTQLAQWLLGATTSVVEPAHSSSASANPIRASSSG